MRRSAASVGEPDGWLPDGSPLFGEIGLVAIDVANDMVQCAACGRWLNTVSGSHLSARHQLTVATYRERYGLGLRTVLEAPGRRRQRRASTFDRMDREPKLRAMLDAGSDRARSGAAMRETAQAALRVSARRPERARQLAERAALGGTASRQKWLDQANERAAAAGFPDIAAFVRGRHGSGLSASEMAVELGCSRARIAEVLRGLQVPRQLDPNHPTEVAAAARVGFPTLAAYLRSRPVGSSPKRMADELGHSVPWLMMRARRDGLAHRLAIPPTAQERATAAALTAGFPNLAAHVRHLAEVQRWTRGRIQRHTGLQSAQVAELLADAADPADLRERDALDAAGWSGTLVDYAVNRDQAGWTVQRMSQELGRSDFWLASRLRRYDAGHLIQRPGRRMDSID